MMFSQALGGGGGGFGPSVGGGQGTFGGPRLGGGGGTPGCGVGPGEEVVACGVAACNGGPCELAYVGPGQGGYIQENNYKFIGAGGDFDHVRHRKDLTCVISCCCVGSLLLLLIPLLLWLLIGHTHTTSMQYDCNEGWLNWETQWSPLKREFCCVTEGKCCPTTVHPQPPTPLSTYHPTYPPTPEGSVDPFNCALGHQCHWSQEKRDWCCHIHHVGCPTQPPTYPPPHPPTYPPHPPPPQPPTAPPRPADPYNCAEGYENWAAGWAIGKKEWCCRIHGKGCAPTAAGCVTNPAPFNCDAGFANWMAGWSIAKKQWCCANGGKGCALASGGCAGAC